jgi:hypothetical protein
VIAACSTPRSPALSRAWFHAAVIASHLFFEYIKLRSLVPRQRRLLQGSLRGVRGDAAWPSVAIHFGGRRVSRTACENCLGGLRAWRAAA